MAEHSSVAGLPALDTVPTRAVGMRLERSIGRGCHCCPAVATTVCFAALVCCLRRLRALREESSQPVFY